MPWKKPVAAPNVADIFPRVRQLVLEGKHAEAMALALQRMSEGPIKPDTEPHLTIPAFLMRLESPKGAAARDYLRTVDFESAELKVHWSDERGDWVRHAFVSRPDNVVVQWLTGPAGQPLNVRVSLHRSAAWSMRSGADWGSHAGIGATSPDREAFNLGANGAPPDGGPSEGRRGLRRPAGLQRAAADLHVSSGSLRRQLRLRRRGSRRAQRRLGADGWRRAGDRERIVRDAAHAHRVLRRLRRGTRGGAPPGGRSDSSRTTRRCSVGPARSSRRCSTASPSISAAPRSTGWPRRSFWPISDRGRTTRPHC